MKTNYKNEILWGLAITGATVVWVLVESFIAVQLNRPDLGNYTGILAVAIPIVGLWIGLIKRKALNKGKLSYKDALKSGLMITVVSAVGNALFMLIYVATFPGVAEFYFKYLEESLLTQGQSPEQVAYTLAQIRAQFTPISQGIQMFLGTLISGTILALLISLFVRTKEVKKSGA